VKFIPMQRAQRRQRRRALGAHALVRRPDAARPPRDRAHRAATGTCSGFRFPVQWVNRPNNPTDPTLHDFRGFSGQIAGGIVPRGPEGAGAARRHRRPP
jgi:hypothetical protein